MPGSNRRSRLSLDEKGNLVHQFAAKKIRSNYRYFNLQEFAAHAGLSSKLVKLILEKDKELKKYIRYKGRYSQAERAFVIREAWKKINKGVRWLNLSELSGNLKIQLSILKPIIESEEKLRAYLRYDNFLSNKEREAIIDDGNKFIERGSRWINVSKIAKKFGILIRTVISVLKENGLEDYIRFGASYSKKEREFILDKARKLVSGSSNYLKLRLLAQTTGYNVDSIKLVVETDAELKKYIRYGKSLSQKEKALILSIGHEMAEKHGGINLSEIGRRVGSNNSLVSDVVKSDEKLKKFISLTPPKYFADKKIVDFYNEFIHSSLRDLENRKDSLLDDFVSFYVDYYSDYAPYLKDSGRQEQISFVQRMLTSRDTQWADAMLKRFEVFRSRKKN